jgi:NAD(P)-dependent dehydrogenase (short-subunit alcohol dehydrogenase family)
VSLAKGRRVVLFADAGGVGEALSAKLGALGVEVLAVADAPPAADLARRLEGWSAAGPVHGLYWLPALDAPGDLARLSAGERQEAVRARVKLFFTALGSLYAPLGEPGAFVIAATRLGGRHGYDDAGALEPLGGAVTGLAKALHRERPEALVKAVDFASALAPEAVAEALIEETLFDPGAVEIGRDAGDISRRLAVGLAEEPLGSGPGLVLGKDTVYLVTGAAGSIVSAILCDLAATGGTFHLLDLAAEPDPNDADVVRLTSDREGLQRDLYERLKARGERATPALVEKELARLERAQAALTAIAAIRAAGGEAVYHQLDLRDAAAVSRAVDEVRRRHGRVDVLLHAAGLEISRLLPDKRSEEFDLVFGVKALGWLNLMAALGDLPLGAAVVFSSVAGRFGNAGQADYSAANDFLCKAISHLRRSRPETFCIALDWTAWGGIGMATRGSIPQAMAAAGIDMLAPEIGIPWVRRELAAGTRGEVVVAGRLGAMLAEPGDGFDPAKAAPAGILAGRAAAWGLYRGLTVETLLVPAEQPFLDHHRIDGTPVLPGVMGIEAFAEAARLAFPDLAVAAVEEVAFHAPFKLYRDEPRSMIVEALLIPDGPDGDGVLAQCRLLGRRRLASQEEEQETVHFTGRVRLAREAAAAPTLAVPEADARSARSIGRDAIYRLYFHGPAFQVVERGWRQGDGVAGQLASPLPADHRPADQPTVMEPRLIELCFQTAGLGELAAKGRLGLPFKVDAVRTLAHPAADARLVAVTHGNGQGVDADVVDEHGTVFLEVRGYRTIEVPEAPDGAALAPFRAALGAGS